MSLSKTALRVDRLAVSSGKKRLLDNISFQLDQGDVLGVIGETGAGKTVLIEALGMSLAPGLTCSVDTLNYRVDETDIALQTYTRADLQQSIWGKKLAFILSNPRNRFNPIMTIGEQFIQILQSNLGLNERVAAAMAQDMLAQVKMPDPQQNMMNYPHELSGGMIQRAAIAIALSLSPKFLLADEPTMGLDVTVQRQVLDLMEDLFQKLNACVVLATRDLGIVANYCNKIAVMYRGKIVEFAKVETFFENPEHPYSRYLLDIAFLAGGSDPESQRTIERPDMTGIGARNALRKEDTTWNC
jgi:peptide/nickel transport system ATP-binding protein